MAQDKLARMQEIARRGLQDKLPPEKRAIFDEAVNRGLIKSEQSPRDYALSEVPMEAVRNIIPSVGSLASSVWEAVTNPIDTARTIAEAGGGALEYLSPEGPKYTPEGEFLSDSPSRGREEQLAAQIGQALVDRYGGYENIKRTLAEDPAGAALDIAGLIAPAVGAAGRTSVAANVAQKFPKTAAATKTALSGPVNVAADTIGSIGSGAGALARETIGLTTGTGATAVKKAVESAPEFRQALKGATKGQDILDTARAGLENIKNARSADYKKLYTEFKKVDEPVDITPTVNELTEKLADFKVARTEDGLDFSRSPLDGDPRAIGEVSRLVEKVETWDDFTPEGMDTLKRTLDNFYTESSQARALVAGVKNKLKSTIAEKVPSYEKMTKGYEQASKTLKDIDQILRLDGNADTALRKLQSSLKEGSEMRQNVLQVVQDAAGVDLEAMISGYLMNQWVPRGGLGKFAAVGAGGAAGGIATGAGSAAMGPTFMGMLLLGSPKIVGNILSTMGLPKKLIRDVVKRNKTLRSGGAAVSSPTVQAGVTAPDRYAEQIQQQLGGM